MAGPEDTHAREDAPADADETRDERARHEAVPTDERPEDATAPRAPEPPDGDEVSDLDD